MDQAEFFIARVPPPSRRIPNLGYRAAQCGKALSSLYAAHPWVKKVLTVTVNCTQCNFCVTLR